MAPVWQSMAVWRRGRKRPQPADAAVPLPDEAPEAAIAGGRLPRHASGSLAVRLALATLGFCIGFMLLSVGLRIWLAWRDNAATLRFELSQLDDVFQGPMAKAIWELDRETLEMQVRSVAQLPSVGRVQVTVFGVDGHADTLTRTQPGWTASDRVPTIERELVFRPYDNEVRTVGRLLIDGDERVLWSRLQAELGAIVLSQMVQSLLLAGLIMWLFHRSVTVHVRQVAQHLQRLSPDTMATPLHMRRRWRDDELGLLAAGVNHLQRTLMGHLERQRRDESELAAHRDHLAELVDDRTTALQAVNERLEALSRLDPLTGLQNRRAFDDAKNAAFHRARRDGVPMSVLLCDVDQFKLYNDTYGHAAGDHCLKAIGAALRESFEWSPGTVARIGGEEFAVLLPGIDTTSAVALAQRLCAAVSALAIPHAASVAAPHVTVSVGVAQSDPTIDQFEVLFMKADEALYRAKRFGRNRIAV